MVYNHDCTVFNENGAHFIGYITILNNCHSLAVANARMFVPLCLDGTCQSAKQTLLANHYEVVVGTQKHTMHCCLRL